MSRELDRSIEKEVLVQCLSNASSAINKFREDHGLEVHSFWFLQWFKWKTEKGMYTVLEDVHLNLSNYSWELNRFENLIEAGWIKKSHTGNHRAGERDKWGQTLFFKSSMNDVYAYLLDKKSKSNPTVGRRRAAAEDRVLGKVFAYAPIVIRYFRSRYDLNIRHFWILQWARRVQLEKKSFTKGDFDRDKACNWNPAAIKVLIDSNWIKLISKGNRRKGEVDKFKLTQSGSNRLSDIDNLLMGYEYIPSNKRFNPLLSKVFSNSKKEWVNKPHVKCIVQCNRDKDFHDKQ